MSCFRFGPWRPKIKYWASWWRRPGRVELLLLLTGPSVLLALRKGEDAADIPSKKGRCFSSKKKSKKDAADTIREDRGGPITTAKLADTSTCKPCTHTHKPCTTPVATTGCAGSWLGLEHGRIAWMPRQQPAAFEVPAPNKEVGDHTSMRYQPTHYIVKIQRMPPLNSYEWSLITHTYIL